MVEAAYRALMKKYHPARWRGNAEEGKARAQDINAAYDALKFRAAASGTVKARAPAVDPYEEPVMPKLTPPFNAGRRLLMTLGASIAILAAGVAMTKL
ncbi:J domain-containing protein [Sphingomonadaceae bacterium OTU29MARTA1]|nr:J domain-containing protein [Sphingomonadaceae bacterium OTU29MARTA1]